MERERERDRYRYRYLVIALPLSLTEAAPGRPKPPTKPAASYLSAYLLLVIASL